MKICLLTHPGAATPSHVIDAAGVAELRDKLSQIGGATYCVAVYRGDDPKPWLVKRTHNFTTARGGMWTLAEARDLWQRCADQIADENYRDQFLDSMRDFTRRAVYQPPKIVKGDD